MKPRSSYFPFPTPPEGAVVLFVLLMVSGCGGGPPFNSYDPPPTFAFKHLAAYPALTTTYLGTRLDGIYLADAASPTFTPTGFVNSFQACGLILEIGRQSMARVGLQDGVWSQPADAAQERRAT
jgi:hypothetical protein